MADPATSHKFRDSDISLREYVDTRVNATVQSREAAVLDVRQLFEQKLGGLKDLLLADMETLRATIDERDKLYTERDNTRRTAVETAVTAVKEQTKASFDASEKAIIKSDVNSEKWRENANEWRAAMMDRESKFAPRAEMDTEFKSLRTELAALKKDRDQNVGGRQQQIDNRAWIAVGVSIVILMLGLATFVLRETAPPSTVPQVIYTPAPAGTQLPTTPPQAVPR